MPPARFGTVQSLTAELHKQIANREAMIQRLGGEVLEMRRLEADASDQNSKLEQMIHAYGLVLSIGISCAKAPLRSV